jgi:hypothetical protein
VSGLFRDAGFFTDLRGHSLDITTRRARHCKLARADCHRNARYLTLSGFSYR